MVHGYIIVTRPKVLDGSLRLGAAPTRDSAGAAGATVTAEPEPLSAESESGAQSGTDTGPGTRAASDRHVSRSPPGSRGRAGRRGAAVTPSPSHSVPVSLSRRLEHDDHDDPAPARGRRTPGCGMRARRRRGLPGPRLSLPALNPGRRRQVQVARGTRAAARPWHTGHTGARRRPLAFHFSPGRPGSSQLEPD